MAGRSIGWGSLAPLVLPAGHLRPVPSAKGLRPQPLGRGGPVAEARGRLTGCLPLSFRPAMARDGAGWIPDVETNSQGARKGRCFQTIHSCLAFVFFPKTTVFLLQGRLCVCTFVGRGVLCGHAGICVLCVCSCAHTYMLCAHLCCVDACVRRCGRHLGLPGRSLQSFQLCWESHLVGSLCRHDSRHRKSPHLPKENKR